MTEADYLLADNVGVLFGKLTRYVTLRTARLFAAACVRATPLAAENDVLLEAAALAEEFADDPAMLQRINELNRRAAEQNYAVELDSVAHMLSLAAYRVTDAELDLRYFQHVPFFLQKAVAGSLSDAAAAQLGDVYCDILRDVVFNPFRGIRGQVIRTARTSSNLKFFNPAWRTEAAVGIAQAAYDSREFGNLPVLADALQDAGCEHPDVLAHLRGHGPHVRGCWVVDLVLGKS